MSNFRVYLVPYSPFKIPFDWHMTRLHLQIVCLLTTYIIFTLDLDYAYGYIIPAYPSIIHPYVYIVPMPTLVYLHMPPLCLHYLILRRFGFQNTYLIKVTSNVF